MNEEPGQFLLGSQVASDKPEKQPFAWLLLLAAWRLVEDVASGIVALVVAAGTLVATIVIVLDRLPINPWARVWYYGLMAVVCLLEFLHFSCLIRCIGKRPYPLQVARMMPRLPSLLGPLVACYWCAHLLFATGFIWMAHSVSLDQPISFRIGALGAGDLCGFWAFGYLLIAIRTIHVDDKWLDYAWKNRFLYLIVISLIALALPYLGLISKA